MIENTSKLSEQWLVQVQSNPEGWKGLRIMKVLKT